MHVFTHTYKLIPSMQFYFKVSQYLMECIRQLGSEVKKNYLMQVKENFNWKTITIEQSMFSYKSKHI